MKILQIHSLYSQYFSEFYDKFSGLSSASFDLQMESLLLDGFGGSHFFAPHMSTIGYEGQLVISNCRIAQFAWLSERGETLENEDAWELEIPLKQVEAFQPDILYLSDSGKFNRDFIRNLAWKPRLIMGFKGVLFEDITDLSDFDVLMSNSSLILSQALQLGAQATESLSPAMPEHIVSAVQDQPACYDLVFTGSYTPMHENRNSYLAHIAHICQQEKKFSVAFCLLNSTPLPEEIAALSYAPQMGIGMYRTLRSGRIVFNADIDFPLKEAGNMRLFEATSIGSFVLTEYHDNISTYFEPGLEVETFRNKEELTAKIEYYLSHPDERDAIARRGQERCLKDHSMSRRIRELDAIIKKHLALKVARNSGTKMDSATATQKSGPEMSLKQDEKSPQQLAHSIAALKEKAISNINNGNVSDAFTLLSNIKSLRTPSEGVDFLRAVCFCRSNDPGNAIVALREELCYFPNNCQAADLLNQLQQMTSPTKSTIEDPEFIKIYEVIAPYTMLNAERLYSLFMLAKFICIQDIPGNFAECGVAAGGSSALLGYVIKTYSKQQRFLYAFDSYEGLPAPAVIDTHNGVEAEVMGWGAGTCSAPEESVRAISMQLGVMHIIKPVKGFYEESLPKFKHFIGPIAFLHVDADWYDSIMTVLTNLYDQLSHNAFVQIDDYGYWEGCRKAFHDFERLNNIKITLNHIDGCAVWFSPEGVTNLAVNSLTKTPSDVKSPLTGSTNVRVVNTIESTALIDLYRVSLNIDVSSYFRGIDKILLYECCDTRYRFYYPFNIIGDSHFYEELQKFPWYYMDWKWEHEIASGWINPSDVVLEIGCGRGGFLQKVQHKVTECVGLEMNREALDQAKAKGLTVFGESLQSFAPKNLNKFDVVCLFQVIEHIPEAAEFLAACLKTMKPGGKLILSVPNNDALMFRLQDISPLNSPPHHMGLWGINSLVSLADILPLSLKSIELEPLQPYHIGDCRELIRQRLVGKGSCTGSSLAECEPVTSKVMELIFENIPGHTIMVMYTKL